MTYKTNIKSTPFLLAFGLETVMPVEFQVPSLRVQTTERLLEAESELTCLEQLLKLGETKITSLSNLEEAQHQRKTLVDRHRQSNEQLFGIGNAVLFFHTRLGGMPGKLQFR